MQSINLQITPSGVMPVVNASQYDYGRLVQFNLFDGASAYIPPEGTEIRVEGRKSDGTVFSYFANYVGNAVIVTLTQQMTVLAEDVPCELRLNVNNEDIGTINFTLAVEPSNIGMAVVSETEIPAIISLARRQELNSEAWANGTRGGVPVSPDDPAYENNAKYWAEHADLGTLENLLDVDVDNLTDGQVIKYNSETEKWENADESGGGSLGNLTDVSLSSPSNKQVLMFNFLQQKWENGDAPSGGMISHIIVESEAGESSVTVTLPSGTVKTCTQVSGSTTQWETTSDEYGTHIIDAYKDGDDAQASLNIKYVGEYLVHDEHYYHTINVTVKAGASIVITGNGETYGGTGTGSALAFAVHGKEATYTVTTSIDGVNAPSQTVTTPATTGQSTSLTFTYGTINLTYANDFRGLSITCSDGNKTITKTAPSGANIMSFYPPNTGTWIISGTVSGQPYSTEAIVVDLSVAVPANLQTVPEGSTVLPTDDIQTWLECAGITDKSYTTLAEVLADSTTLAALIADNNAVDYMVRSKSWASNKGLVPQMTSNTAPSGTVSASSVQTESSYTYQSWYAFDRNNSTLWKANTMDNSWIQYTFPSAVNIKSAHILTEAGRMNAYEIKASNDNFATSTTLYSGDLTQQTEATPSFSNDNNYTQVRLYTGASAASGDGNRGVLELQFYDHAYYEGNGITEDSTAMTYIGLNNYASNTLLADSDWLTAIANSAYIDSVLNAKAPTMTDDTHPSGIAFTNGTLSASYPAYKAFDNDVSTVWASSSGAGQKICGYIFDNPIKMYLVVNTGDSTRVSSGTDITIQSSNDTTNGLDGNWTDIGSHSRQTGQTPETVKAIINNVVNAYKGYRISTTLSSGTDSYYYESRSLQFYGRQDV